MNHVYCTLFNASLRLFQVASENSRSHSKASGRCGTAKTALAINALLLAPLSFASLPTGGNIVHGSGSIATPTAQQLLVNQTSHKLITDWQSFNIAEGHGVTFNQPSAAAVALNRVVGSDASKILGNLNANGQVFLVNPNGILFGQHAQVNVGGLVASTLDISNTDFIDGNYRFSGDGSAAAVLNQGRITAADGGAVALLGGRVSNEGIIQARLGSVALAAGQAITLDFAGDGLLSVQIDQPTLDALVANHQLIQADGGQVLLTASAADALLQTVVNNTGVIRARTLEEREGKIVLLGDFVGGTVQVAGTLDASAPDGGDGGFIDTSGAYVQIAAGTRVTTKASAGTTGIWLIDPTDLTISAGDAPQTSSGIGADTLATNLADNNITLATIVEGEENGDIHVNAAVSWDANTTLTLQAHGDINVNARITASGESAGLVLLAGGDYQIDSARLDFDANPIGYENAGITLAGTNASLTINGQAYTLLHSLADFEQINTAGGAGYYALARNLDAGGTTYTAALVTTLSGTLAGLGNQISNLQIDAGPTGEYVGLIGHATAGSLIRDIGLEDAHTLGQMRVGTLLGWGSGVTIHNAWASGTVTGMGNGISVYWLGGLVGGLYDASSLSHSRAAVAVRGTKNTESSNDWIFETRATDVGGLVGGMRQSSISHAYATGDVNANGSAGGLVGNMMTGSSIEFSWASGKVTGELHSEDFGSTNPSSAMMIGGLIGQVQAVDPASNHISNVRATGDVVGGFQVGGLIGYNIGTVSNATASGNVRTYTREEGCYLPNSVGGLIGYNQGNVTNAHASGDVTAVGSTTDIVNFITDGVGGLIGTNQSGNVVSSSASGNVIGGSSVGGLVGDNRNGHIIASWASGDVTAYFFGAGGLIGYQRNGDISHSSAYGNVYGLNNLGGLVGGNAGRVSNSHAYGNVSFSTLLFETTGGYSSMTYSQDNVTAGGLIGNNSGTVEDSSASGNVTGGYRTGALVGYNMGSVSKSSATGQVDSNGNESGGLVGENSTLHGGTIDAASNWNPAPSTGGGDDNSDTTPEGEAPIASDDTQPNALDTPMLAALTQATRQLQPLPASVPRSFEGNTTQALGLLNARMTPADGGSVVDTASPASFSANIQRIEVDGVIYELELDGDCDGPECGD